MFVFKAKVKREGLTEQHEGLAFSDFNIVADFEEETPLVSTFKQETEKKINKMGMNTLYPDLKNLKFINSDR